MSKVHILAQNAKKDSVRVVYHIDIPDVDNSAGVGYRLAISEMLNLRSEPITSNIYNLDTKDPTEWANLQAGAVFEIVKTIEFDANLTDGQKAAVVDADYLAQKDALLTEIQSKLKFWGMSRNPS